jgi:hypothetical protein
LQEKRDDPQSAALLSMEPVSSGRFLDGNKGNRL